MASATDLPQAAGQSFHNLFTLWLPGGDALQSAVAAFADTLLPTFPDGETVGRPIADWLVLIASIAQQMPSVTAPDQVPYGQLAAAADYVYRICWLAAKPTPQAPAISNAQQAAILTAYNANF
jgi:hypothetical protein